MSVLRSCIMYVDRHGQLKIAVGVVLFKGYADI